MLCPLPLPEELSLGYLGFIMRLNGYGSKAETVGAMAAHFGSSQKSRRQLPCLELLSMTAGMSTEDFTKNHTLLPLRRAITSYHPDLLHGNVARRSILYQSAMKSCRPGWYFCSDCAKADVEFHGLSYWRRDHQVPGQMWCAKHRTALMYVDSDDAVLAPPSSAAKLANRVPVQQVKGIIDNPAVNRYLDIAYGLMERDRPLDVPPVATVLRQRAIRRGLQSYGGQVRNPLLSDLIRTEMPVNWLATVFSGLADKDYGQLSHQVDGVLFMNTAASNVFPYLLAAAVLFELADEALNELMSPPLRPEDVASGPPLSLATAPARRDDAAVARAYCRARGSYEMAADHLSTSRKVLAPRLRALGLLDLKSDDDGKLQAAAVAFFVENRSMADSLTASGISMGQFEKLLKAAGAPLTAALVKFPRPGDVDERGKSIARKRALTPQEVDLSPQDQPLAPNLLRREHER